MITALLALVAQAGAAPAPSLEQALWQRLEQRLHAIEARADGVFAFSVTDLATGRTLELRPDQPLATASCIKAAVLLEAYHAAAAGRLDLQEVVPAPSPRVGGGGVLELVGPGARLSWRDMAALMMAYSDNDAANALMERVGFEAVNGRLQALGLAHTTLRRRMMDGAAARAGRENVSSAGDMRRLMVAIREASGLPPALAADLRTVAALPKRSEFEVALATDVPVLAKTGLLDGVRCWAAAVELPGRPFAAAIMAGHLRDEAAGEAAIREMAAEVLATFDRLARGSEFGRAGMR